MDANQAAPTHDVADLQSERDALRIQAAAVAAQQASLTDQEKQLNQRRAALQQRERQIAEHLEERQKRLLALRDEIKQERGVVEQEQKNLETRKAALTDHLGKAQKQTERERRRFMEARKRFKQRWLHYTAEKQSGLRQHERQVHAEQQRLQQEADALQRERAQFGETRLRLNGEIELSRTELKAAWQELALAQQQWDEALNYEHRDREQQRRILEAREAAVADREQKLAEESRQFEELRSRLLKETEGLENRVRNRRYQLQEMQQKAPAVVDIPTIAVTRIAKPSHETANGSMDEPPEIVHRIAGHLADQRWLLLEHWSRFLQIVDAWHGDHAAVLAAVEETSRRLQERERRLEEQEIALDDRTAAVRQQHEALARSRAELDNWHLRLTLRETNEESERTRQWAVAEGRERTATALIEQLEAVRRRRQERRRQEIEELRQTRRQCEALRQKYLLLIHQVQEQEAEFAKQQRALAAQTAAVERYRIECLNRATNSPAAERRLEKLRRRAQARIEAGEREVTAQRQALAAEAHRMEERARHLQRREDELIALQSNLAQRETELEQRQLAQTETELPREQTIRLLQTQHEHDMRQLAVLRDEVERVALLLLDDGAVDVNRAA
jgi:hypothetical protein